MSAKEKRTKAKYQAERLSTAHAPEHHFPQFYFSKSRDRDPSENDEHRTQTIVQSEKAMRRGLHCTVPIQYFSLFFLFPFPIFSQYILFFFFFFLFDHGTSSSPLENPVHRTGSAIEKIQSTAVAETKTQTTSFPKNGYQARRSERQSRG